MGTGKAESISAKADELLVAADKYDLGELKLLCENTLIEELGTENVFTLLMLADQQRAGKLRQAALQFIQSRGMQLTANKEEIMNKLKNSPDLMAEVFIMLAKI